MFKGYFENFKNKTGATSQEEFSALKARESAMKEKDVSAKKAQFESEETQRLSRLLAEDLAKNAGPHVITKEAEREAQKILKKESDK